jgi:hypothetical protein
MAQQKISILEDNGSKTMRVLDTLTPINGTTAPSVNAKYLGQIYVDSTAKAVFISVAVGSSTPANDWQKMTAAV